MRIHCLGSIRMKFDQNESRHDGAVMNLLAIVRDLKGKAATTGAVDHQRRRANVQSVLASLLRASAPTGGD